MHIFNDSSLFVLRAGNQPQSLGISKSTTPSYNTSLLESTSPTTQPKHTTTTTIATNAYSLQKQTSRMNDGTRKTSRETCASSSSPASSPITPVMGSPQPQLMFANFSDRPATLENIGAWSSVQQHPPSNSRTIESADDVDILDRKYSAMGVSEKAPFDIDLDEKFPSESKFFRNLSCASISSHNHRNDNQSGDRADNNGSIHAGVKIEPSERIGNVAIIGNADDDLGSVSASSNIDYDALDEAILRGRSTTLPDIFAPPPIRRFSTMNSIESSTYSGGHISPLSATSLSSHNLSAQNNQGHNPLIHGRALSPFSLSLNIHKIHQTNSLDYQLASPIDHIQTGGIDSNGNNADLVLSPYSLNASASSAKKIPMSRNDSSLNSTGRMNGSGVPRAVASSKGSIGDSRSGSTVNSIDNSAQQDTGNNCGALQSVANGGISYSASSGAQVISGSVMYGSIGHQLATMHEENGATSPTLADNIQPSIIGGDGPNISRGSTSIPITTTGPSSLNGEQLPMLNTCAASFSSPNYGPRSATVAHSAPYIWSPSAGISPAPMPTLGGLQYQCFHSSSSPVYRDGFSELKGVGISNSDHTMNCNASASFVPSRINSLKDVRRQPVNSGSEVSADTILNRVTNAQGHISPLTALQRRHSLAGTGLQLRSSSGYSTDVSIGQKRFEPGMTSFSASTAFPCLNTSVSSLNYTQQSQQMYDSAIDYPKYPMFMSSTSANSLSIAASTTPSNVFISQQQQQLQQTMNTNSSVSPFNLSIRHNSTPAIAVPIPRHTHQSPPPSLTQQQSSTQLNTAAIPLGGLSANGYMHHPGAIPGPGMPHNYFGGPMVPPPPHSHMVPPSMPPHHHMAGHPNIPQLTSQQGCPQQQQQQPQLIMRHSSSHIAPLVHTKGQISAQSTQAQIQQSHLRRASHPALSHPGFAHSNGQALSGPIPIMAPTPIMPGGSMPMMPNPATAMTANMPFADMGKGIAYSSLPAKSRVYIVQFKGKRCDLYFAPCKEAMKLLPPIVPYTSAMPVPNTLRYSNFDSGTYVLVEADRGVDLGMIKEELTTPEAIRAFSQSLSDIAAASSFDSVVEHGPSQSSQKIGGTHTADTASTSTDCSSNSAISDSERAVDRTISPYDKRAPNSTKSTGSSNGAGRDTREKEVFIKRIFREADQREIADLMGNKVLDEQKALAMCQSKVAQHKLSMRVVDAEFQFDRRKLTFYFVADRRVDFRELVRELFKHFKTRIWMCQQTN